MNTFFSRLITVVACFFIFSAAWFCLWSISLHLVERPELAALLFPFGLRLGLMLQCPLDSTARFRKTCQRQFPPVAANYYPE